VTRQRHWRNYGTGGDACFISTSALDFNLVFRRYAVRDELTACLAYACAKRACLLNAFVVMPSHVHLLVTLAPECRVVDLAGLFKTVSAKRLMPLLESGEADGFREQKGLNRRSFWQRSFRSVAVYGVDAFQTKVRYIHSNPVEAGLCSDRSGYRWSSANDDVQRFLGSDGVFDCVGLEAFYRNGRS
jgi:REP element-mobilizing transposase RayT